MATKAPAGPPICTFDPPSSETSAPPMMAVMSPCSGLTPLAMPKAMASGRATQATVRPAPRSAMKSGLR